jgi:hypothetical protein
MPNTASGMPSWIDRLFSRQVAPILLPFFLYVGLRAVLELAAGVHWLMGLIAAVVAAIVAWLLIRGLQKKEYRGFSVPVTIGIFLTAAVFAISAFAAMSTLIYTYYPDAYWRGEAFENKEINVGRFADFYSYILLDAIPGVKLFDTLQIPAPVSYRGWLPAGLLLVFRVAVVVALIDALKDWVRGTSDGSSHQARPASETAASAGAAAEAPRAPSATEPR